MLNKISLKLRITLLTGLIITLIAISLTALGIFNSNQLFVKPVMLMNAVVDGNPIEAMPAIPLQVPESNNSHAVMSTIKAQTIVTTAQSGFSRQSIIIMILIILVGLGITYFIVGRALTPLTSLSGTIANITEHNLNEQAQSASTADEIASLTHSFNDMLARLQQSFEQQRRFSASAAHELKTPLSTIKTSLQVLNLDETPSLSDYSENAAIVSESVDRLIEIVNNLLLFSNSDAQLNDKINLAEIINQCICELACKIQEKNLTVTFASADLQEFHINGNLALMHSAIYNLLENAAKYNRENGTIKITLEAESGIIIKIQDTGFGIPSEAIPHVSEPFYRADKSRSKDIPGNGLGLAIVKSIVQNHRGEIDISSQYQLGTAVQIRFPLQ